MGNQCLFCGRDLWEVGHSVTNGTIAICEICVGDCAMMIAEASPEDRSLTLPPRLFGEAPDDVAVSSVVEAITGVFSGSSDANLDRQLEDASTLGPYLRQADERVSLGDVVATVRRIRFTDAELAWVEVFIRVGPGIQFSLEGPVRRVDGEWKVTRELLSKAVSRAGVQIPPES